MAAILRPPQSAILPCMNVSPGFEQYSYRRCLSFPRRPPERRISRCMDIGPGFEQKLDLFTLSLPPSDLQRLVQAQYPRSRSCTVEIAHNDFMFFLTCC